MTLTAKTLPILLALISFGAAGCDIHREDWSSVPQTRAPKVESVSYTHSVVFAENTFILTLEHRRQLDRFVARTQVGREDRIEVLAGPGRQAPMDRRVESVAAYLRHLGAQVSAGAAGFGDRPPAAKTVDVVVRRPIVVLPGCPDWSAKPDDTYDNVVSRNWGCATATNLGMMIANPRDLVAGRRLTPADGDAAVLAIQRYRAGEIKPLAPEDVGTIEAQQRQDSGAGN